MEVEIVTSDKFIQEGANYPPQFSTKRLRRYNNNNARYSIERAKDNPIFVTNMKGKRKRLKVKRHEYGIARVITDRFLAGLLKEKPLVSYNDKEVEKEINKVIRRNNLWSCVRKVAHNYSVTGDGYFHVFRGKRRKLGSINPQNVYKVVADYDIDEVKCYILVRYEYEYTLVEGDYKEKPIRLVVIKHFGEGLGLLGEEGYYFTETYEYDYKSGKIGKLLSRSEKKATGLKGFAVHHIKNGDDGDKVYGTSDYKPLVPFIEVIEKLLTTLQQGVDKQQHPIFVADDKSFKKRQEIGTGNMKMEVSEEVAEGQFPMKSDANMVAPQFIAFPDLSASTISTITLLENMLMYLSQYGEVFLKGEYKAGTSGETLKSAIKGALDKISGHIDLIEPAIIDVIVQLCQLEGVEIKAEDLSIQWQDGVSEGIKTVAETAKILVDGGIFPVSEVQQMYWAKTVEQAENSVEEVVEEDKKLEGENEDE